MKNWEKKKLSELCDLITKGTTPTSIGYKFTDEGINFIKVESLTESGEIIPNKVAFIDEECHKALKRSQLKVNDILFSIAGALGRIGIVRDEIVPANTNQALAIIRLKNDSGVLVNYLAKYFNSNLITDEIEKLRGGAAQQNLSLTQLNELQIPLPPLPEQQRIVAILDEAFAAIAKAKTNAEQNLKNAKELFESYLQGVFENGNWETKTLKELTTKIGSGATPRGGQESYKSEGISLVRSMNVHDWEFRERNLAFIDEKQAKELDGVTLQVDDVLLNITGASVARSCVFPKEYLPARVNQHVSIIRPKKELLDARFLNLLLTSKPYKDQLLSTGELGATRQAITKSQIEAFRIAIPQIKDQQTIVQKLDALSTETKKLEAIYQQKINDLEELKKSILAKAFAGELTSSVSVSLPFATKVIPLQKLDGISTTDLQAGITAMALQKHIELNKHDVFGHVKAEKIVHLAEYVLNVDLERNPVKDVAGPNDFPHAKKVESRAAKAGFYNVSKRQADQETGYTFTEGNSINKLIQKTQNCLGEREKVLSQLFKLIVPMKTQQAEIVATIYGAWNNLILKSVEFIDEDIVTEARENWREEKLKIPREKFFNAIEWMRKNEILIPKGNGKIVEAK